MLNERMVGLGTERSVIRELFEYGKQRAAEIGPENVFDFSIGNPSVPAPDTVGETAIRLLKEEDSVLLHGYTSAQGDAGVRSMIADSVNARYGSSIGPDNLYITVGAAAALCCCFNGLCNPGDEVIVFAPYFPEYKVFIEGSGAVMRLIPADIESFQIDFPAFEAALNENTKAVLINSPNNPSGAVYSEKTIKHLTDILKEKSAGYGHPIYLVTDEPYREIVFNHVTIPYIPDFYDNTLLCYSWSKSLSLPGERMGYILVPNEMEDFEKVYAAIAGAGRSLGYVNAPSLFQKVCGLCVDQVSDVSIYDRNKNILYKALTDMGFTAVEPAGAFYMFPRTLDPDDMAFCERAKEYNLLLVPGTGFGCPGHTRISFCVQTEMLERALPAFEKLAASYR